MFQMIQSFSNNNSIDFSTFLISSASALAFSLREVFLAVSWPSLKMALNIQLDTNDWKLKENLWRRATKTSILATFLHARQEEGKVSGQVRTAGLGEQFGRKILTMVSNRFPLGL